MDAWLDNLPNWFGTVPQWGMFVLLGIAIVRTSPQWLTTWSTLRLAKSNANAERIKVLEQQVRDCIAECSAHTRQLQDKIQGLQSQRNAEQLVVMRAIVGMSNDPAVKRQLELLEAMEISLARAKREGANDEGVQDEGA